MQRLEHRDQEAMELWIEILKTRIESLDLSVRTVNALSNANIRTIGGLARKKEEDFGGVGGPPMSLQAQRPRFLLGLPKILSLFFL
jgi:hypothetical protein